jgi:putative SOS response-associated peptidase YedK
VTGPAAVGAIHGRVGAVASGTRTVCNPGHPVSIARPDPPAGWDRYGTVADVCGRYATSRSSVDLAALFAATDEVEGLEPDYNVAPTDPVPVVRVSSGQRVLNVARWGLLPHWAKDARAGARMINARVETVASANAFAPSFARRRCLVPADGWYEWVKISTSGKQAYFMTPADGQPVAFAGVWARWGPDNLLTCSIITMPAMDDLAMIHDRMPLLLPPERWSAWLDGPPSDELLAPPPASLVAGLELRPVSAAVGDVRNDGRALTERVQAPPLDLPLF